MFTYILMPNNMVILYVHLHIFMFRMVLYNSHSTLELSFYIYLVLIHSIVYLCCQITYNFMIVYFIFVPFSIPSTLIIYWHLSAHMHVCDKWQPIAKEFPENRRAAALRIRAVLAYTKRRYGIKFQRNFSNRCIKLIRCIANVVNVSITPDRYTESFAIYTINIKIKAFQRLPMFENVWFCLTTNLINASINTNTGTYNN